MILLGHSGLHAELLKGLSIRWCHSHRNYAVSVNHYFYMVTAPQANSLFGAAILSSLRDGVMFDLSQSLI